MILIFEVDTGTNLVQVIKALVGERDIDSKQCSCGVVLPTRLGIPWGYRQGPQSNKHGIQNKDYMSPVKFTIFRNNKRYFKNLELKMQHDTNRSILDSTFNSIAEGKSSKILEDIINQVFNLESPGPVSISLEKTFLSWKGIWKSNERCPTFQRLRI